MSETPSNFGADNAPEVAVPPQPPTPPTPPTPPATPAMSTPPAPPVAPPTPPVAPAAPVAQAPAQTPAPVQAAAPAPAQPAPAPAQTPVAPASQAVYSTPYSAPESQTISGAVASPYGAQSMSYTGVPEQVAPPFQVPSATKSFFGRLFDMSFSTYIAPSFVKVMYILSLIGIWGSWLVYLIIGTAAAGEWDAGAGFTAFLAIFVLGGLVAFLSTLFVRASLEFLIATIKTAENTNRLRELKEVEKAEKQ